MSSSAKRGLVALALVALVALLAWLWMSRNGAPHASTAAPAAAKRDEPRAAAPAPELDAPVARDEAPAHVETAAPTAAEPPPSPAREPDLDAREWVTFRVKNAKGFPVGGAEIVLTGLRTKRERGSHYAWRGEPSLGKTAADGTLKLAYPVWVDLNEETGDVSFTVTHPDYATFEDTGRTIEPGVDIEVVLAMGSVLVVSGWTGDPTHVVTDVQAEFGWDVDVGPDDWLPRRDGRLTTTRVPRGKHVAYLRHKSDELGLMYSDVTEFVIDSGETVELHLELKPPLQLTGKLDDAVPRPVVDGRVVLASQRRVPGAAGALLRTFDMPVAADGTFAIGGIMGGDIQIVALCDGWASKPQLLPRDTEDGAEPSEPRWVSQVVELQPGTTEYVIAMEPTAALEVELRAPDGELLAGARVDVWPNACWLIGACGIFLDDRTWSAVTDERGLARIENIPAGEHNFGVAHDAYELSLDPPGEPTAQRHRRGTFEPGQTQRVELKLERRGG